MAEDLPPSHLSSSSSSSSIRQFLTVWMKSLVMNGNGCTVYDSNGLIVYRVDNYAYRCSNEVYLMDCDGRTLTKIIKKKLKIFGQWEGYEGSKVEDKDPMFRVQKAPRIFRGDQSFEALVTVGGGSNNPNWYKIHRLTCRPEYKITDMAGGLVAQVKRKLTTSGVALGDDVFTLVLEPNVDQLLIMGLVIVCGLFSHSL